MIEFLNMDGYGIYIWPAYAIAFSLISIFYILDLLNNLKDLKKKFRPLNRKLQQRKSKLQETL